MTTTNQDARTGRVEVNETTLYYEKRGTGPGLLLISGATGDAGHWERIVDTLAAEHTVVSYDRRANSRSPRPDGWTSTTTDEQADDAAALIAALDLAPAAVIGNSGGAIIALNLLVRHPGVLRSIVLHEPPLLSVLRDADAVMATIQPLIETGMAEGGPVGATRAFLGFAAGDATRHLDRTTYERMTGNGETFLGVEFGAFESYRPTDQELASPAVPVHVLVGAHSAPFFAEAGHWLADRLGTEVVTTPGAHVPMMSHPDQFAALLKPLL